MALMIFISLYFFAFSVCKIVPYVAVTDVQNPGIPRHGTSRRWTRGIC